MSTFLMMMETSLDVLSRAASLMNPKQKHDQESNIIHIKEEPKLNLSENPRKRNYINLKNTVKTAYTQTSPVSPLPKTRMGSGPPPLISISSKIKQEPMDPIQVTVSLTRPSVITSTKVIGQTVSYVSNEYHTPRNMAPVPGFHRREVVETTSSMVDPFVEEHFRRSLGSDYKHVSPDTMTVAGSVDEHFAKALGDTWSQINGGNNSPSKPHSLVSS